MSIILFQDGFNIDSGEVRPKRPRDHYTIEIQVVQRYDDGRYGKAVPRKDAEINLSVVHTADDTEAEFDMLLPMNVVSATALRDKLTEAIEAAARRAGGEESHQ